MFRGEYVNEVGTVLLTAASAAAAVFGTAVLAVAIFGSCPTVYAEVEGQKLIQMEAFSYSIAPLFESRDVAALSAGEDEEGRISLELKKRSA